MTQSDIQRVDSVPPRLEIVRARPPASPRSATRPDVIHPTRGVSIDGIRTRIIAAGAALLMFAVGALAISRADAGEDSASHATTCPTRVIPLPATPAKLLCNLAYVAEHNLVFESDFIARKNLRRLFGASHIDGGAEATGVSLLMQLIAAPHQVSFSPGNILPGGNILLRSDGSRTVWSIQLQIADPAARPTYDVVDRIVADRWTPVVDNSPQPHSHQVFPTAPHGNAHMRTEWQANDARNSLDAVFDAGGKLLNFTVNVQRHNAGSN